MPNVENIKKVIELIRSKEPQQFKMSRYAQMYNPLTREYETSPAYEVTGEVYPPHVCTTAACLGGWANAQRAKDRDLGDAFDYDDRFGAAEYMGISHTWARSLFCPDDGKWEDYTQDGNSPWIQAGHLGLIPEEHNPYETTRDQAIRLLEAIIDGRIKDHDHDSEVQEDDL